MINKIDYKDTLRFLGLRIQLFRKQKHITQEKLAELIDKSKDTVSNIERGLAFARIETLIDICNTLEVELKDLFEYPIANDVTTKKVKIIEEVSKILVTQSDEQAEKFLQVLKLMC